MTDWQKMSWNIENEDQVTIEGVASSAEASTTFPSFIASLKMKFRFQEQLVAQKQSQSFIASGVMGSAL